jgi:uncharacterized cupredoxin-like copper-binding protein
MTACGALRHRRPRRALAWALAAVGLALAGCGSSSGSGGSAAATHVDVTERDFHIGLSTASVQAGTVRLRIHNAGPDDHELIVAPGRPGSLPLRPDGFTVSEERIGSSEPGSIGPQKPGGTESLVLTLKPGRYVLFCNMEGHFMAGMHTTLVVR